MSYMGMESGPWMTTLPVEPHTYINGPTKMKAQGTRVPPSTSPIVPSSSRLSLTPLKKIWQKPREDGNEVGDMGQAQNTNAGQHWQSALLASSGIPSRTNSTTDIGRAVRYPYPGSPSPKPTMGSHPIVTTTKRPVDPYNISGSFPEASHYSATSSPPYSHSFPVTNTHPLANSHPINSTYSATSSFSGIGSFPVTSSYPATNGYRASTTYPALPSQTTERSTSLMKSQPISKSELKTTEMWTTSTSPSPSSTPVVPVIATWTKTKVTSARPEVSVYRPKQQDTRYRSRLPSQDTLGGSSSSCGTSMSIDSPLTSASLSMTSSNLSPMNSSNLSNLYGVPCGLPNPLARSFPIVGYVSDGELSPDYDAKYHPLSSVPQEESPPSRQRPRRAAEAELRSDSAYRRDESPYLRNKSATPSSPSADAAATIAVLDSALQADLIPRIQTRLVEDTEKTDKDQRPSSRRDSVCSNVSDEEFREHLSNIYGFGDPSSTPSSLIVVPIAAPVAVPAPIVIAPVLAAVKIMTKEIPTVLTEITEITEITDDTPIDLDILKARKDQCMLGRGYFEQRELPPPPPPPAAVALATTYSCSRTQSYNCPRTRLMIRSSFSSESVFDEMLKNGFQSKDLTLSSPFASISSCPSMESLSEPWTEILKDLEEDEKTTPSSKIGIRYMTLRLTLTPWHARAEERALFGSDPVLLSLAAPRTKKRSRARRSVTSSASFLSTKATKLLARSSVTPISNTVHPLVTSMLQPSLGSFHSFIPTSPTQSKQRQQRSVLDPRPRSPVAPTTSDALKASFTGFPVVCFTPPEPPGSPSQHEKIYGLEKPRSKEIKIKDRKKPKRPSTKIQVPPPGFPLPPPPSSPAPASAPASPLLSGSPPESCGPRQGSSSPTLLAMAAFSAAAAAVAGDASTGSPRRPSPPATLTRTGSDIVLATRISPVFLGASPLVRQRTISAPLQPIAKVLDRTSSLTHAISSLQ